MKPKKDTVEEPVAQTAVAQTSNAANPSIELAELMERATRPEPPPRTTVRPKVPALERRPYDKD